ncbi:NRBP2 protein, partial [Certhia brachydactyla]|nr:NRBP2 protein [Certhia brachydactyla]
RNGIYPLMNFAVSRPHALPRVLSQPQEDPQKAKTPTPEPFDVETRKVRAGPAVPTPPFQLCPPPGLTGLSHLSQLTLLLILEDKLHRQLSYDLLPSWRCRGQPSRDPVGSFQDDCDKLAAFLESAFHKHRSQ